jgi:hypothetical protein
MSPNTCTATTMHCCLNLKILQPPADLTKQQEQRPNLRHDNKMLKKWRPKSTRTVLTPDSSSHHETSHDAAKRRKTRHSTETSLAPASQRTNETTKIIPERSPPDLGSGISRYHLHSSASRNEAKQQPVWQDHSSCAGEKSDEEAILDVLGDQPDIGTSPLCHHCKYIFDNWSKWIDNEDFRYPHYENRFQLIDSAKNGCSLCYQFCRNEFEGRYKDWRFREEGVAGVLVVREENYGSRKDLISMTLALKAFSGPGNPPVDGLYEFDEFEVDMTPAVPIGEQIQLLTSLNG